MIVSKASLSTIATARIPSKATRICISLASNPDSEWKIHQPRSRMPLAGAAPHVMKMARFLPALLVVGLCLAACGGGGGAGGPLRQKIAFLLPRSPAARYENPDLPGFLIKVEALCSHD